MKTIIKIIPLICLFVGLLTSCSPSTPIVVIPTVTLTVTPESTKTAIPASPTKVAQQVYRDPSGWYSITFPAELKPMDKPNLFLDENSSLETGYLPSLGYMETALQVCRLLVDGAKTAEIEETLENMDTSCTISGWKYPDEIFTYTVWQNVKADFAHRFVYVQKGGSLAEPANINFTTFSWLQRSSVAVPTGNLEPLNAKEAAFWAKVSPMPANVVVTERVALRAWNGSPMTRDGLGRKVPPYDEPVEIPTPRKITINELGYEIRDVPSVIEGEKTTLSFLYKGSKLLFDAHVYRVSEVYTVMTKAGPVNAFFVALFQKDNNVFLIQNGVIYKWGYDSQLTDLYLIPPPILYQGELLWAKKVSNNTIEIKKSNGHIVFTSPSIDWMKINRYKFRGWHGHWILEVGDFVVMDGQILNTKLDFSKIFMWRLIKDKPVFLFQKGASAGVSYDGQVLPLQYQEIAHGMCCSPAQNNPWVYDNWISFYGKRDGMWYSVLVEFK